VHNESALALLGEAEPHQLALDGMA
jgi:hypothetical protein